MPKKQKANEKSGEGILVSAAKAIGTAAGKIAHIAGVEPDAAMPKKSQKVGKLPKKNKHRLPRAEKKAAQKKRG